MLEVFPETGNNENQEKKLSRHTNFLLTEVHRRLWKRGRVTHGEEKNGKAVMM